MDIPKGRVRASDGEREEYAQIVRTAMGEGRLDLETGETRLAAAYAATYRDELAPLIGDLPAGTLFETPEFRSREGRHLRRHAYRGMTVALVLIGIWAVSVAATGPHFFWPIIPIALITIGVLRHRRYHRWHLEGGNDPGRGFGPHPVRAGMRHGLREHHWPSR